DGTACEDEPLAVVYSAVGPSGTFSAFYEIVEAGNDYSWRVRADDVNSCGPPALWSEGETFHMKDDDPPPSAPPTVAPVVRSVYGYPLGFVVLVFQEVFGATSYQFEIFEGDPDDQSYLGPLHSSPTVAASALPASFEELVALGYFVPAPWSVFV